MASAAESPPDLPPVPERIGRYEVLGKVAAGGMATVYLGRALGAAGFERLVAIKACHPHLLADRVFRTMFLDEARLAAHIHHPNVVATIDVTDSDGLFQVMEYVEGGRASDLILATRAANTHVAAPIAARILVDALSGLQAAHEATDPDGKPLQIVHRDISPQNILVGVNGVTRVADFGVAKAEARATVTATGEIKGKLAYMAPEQATNGSASWQTDVYSSGVVLWELLTGKRLFEGDSKTDVLQQILFRPFVPPSAAAPGVPAELDEIVKRAMSRSGEARYQSAREFAEALESCDVASHRQVADYVKQWLGPAIEQRRALARGQRDRLEVARGDATTYVRRIRSAKHAAKRPKVLLAAVALSAGLAAAAMWSTQVDLGTTPAVAEPPATASIAVPPPVPTVAGAHANADGDWPPEDGITPRHDREREAADPGPPAAPEPVTASGVEVRMSKARARRRMRRMLHRRRNQVRRARASKRGGEYEPGFL